MRQNQASLTAAGIAMLRALESERPEAERVIFDPYARQFVPGWLYAVGKLFTAIGYGELRGPGVQGFLTARERFVDDFLEASLAGGLEQLVILGAGYDARAYRYQARLKGVAVFEVDHPATQANKRARLRQIGEVAANQVRYVEIDFDTQALDERLAQYGYDPAGKTLFIWQGVTYYLSDEAVDATLAFVAQRSGHGSAIIFDFIDRSILSRTGRHGEVANVRRYARLTGEGMRFGIPDGQVEAFLTRRGFEQVRCARAAELHDLYFTGQRQRRTIAAGYGIVSAMVP